MPKLFWLVYRNDDDVGVSIQPALSLIYARMRAALAGMYGEFQEGHGRAARARQIAMMLSSADANVVEAYAAECEAEAKRLIEIQSVPIAA